MRAAKTTATVLSLGLVPAYEWWRSGFHPITEKQLEAVFPSLPAAQRAAYLRPLNEALREGGVTTRQRVAAFLAQVGHESAELTRFEEGASGEAYEGRAALGNTQPGDGPRFKGRGPIQLTGRANYTAASKALGTDLVNDPGRAASPREGFRVAVWFWNSRSLSPLADMGTMEAFREITRRINGGQNGAAHREALWARAQAALR